MLNQHHFGTIIGINIVGSGDRTFASGDEDGFADGLRDAIAAAGNSQNRGSAAVTEAPDTVSGAGSASTSGSAAIAELPDTIAGTATAVLGLAATRPVLGEGRALREAGAPAEGVAAAAAAMGLGRGFGAGQRTEE